MLIEVMEIWHCRVPPLTLTLLTMDNSTTNWTDLDRTELSLEDMLTILANNNTSTNTTLADDGGLMSCGEWEPAQHNLFQLSNIFFAAAFMVPRKFKQSVLVLRALLCAGFIVSALWAGIHVCTPDMFAWNLLLAGLNLIHAVILTCRFLPPALSVELTELYVRMFKPLKVSRNHFKELTREASLLQLNTGENYAKEDSTPADERLSILLRGKLKVSVEGMHLHYIHPFQFIDSPEWEAGHETSDDLFQVTISAEEDSLYLCWPKIKMARVLRHRPMLRTILSNLIGKDITQKLYSLNEQLGSALQLNMINKVPKADHWRYVMTRSLSVDAVSTGTKGHVRSHVWRQGQNNRRNSLGMSESLSPMRGGQQQCWIPIVANHFPATSPFVGPPPNPAAAGAPASPVALIPVPVIVPVLPPPPAASRPARRPREVKFDESKV
ncbi:blood vessel epicardial substance-like [Macrosteles quadrilineatus]|uniref:blood vessel epicardial substance-like n=1 Tax=Macrosteles quadrilineatus TaxID=74068 RepID=UPI0023E295BC|nr:blood vessel epicardial substance-like [Macrosteles quadrilineatus]